MLSIVTITYKDSKGLKTTIDSLEPLLNSGIVWEHVVIDSSPDDNKATLSDLPKGWPLKRIESLPLGIYAALNCGIDNAQGKYIWFLNGGDRLKARDVLETSIAKLETQPKASILWAGAELMRDGKRYYPRWPATSLLSGLVGANSICHQALLYRSEVFKTVGKFSTRFKLASDYEHHWRCQIAGVELITLHELLVQYDITGNSSNFRAALHEFRRVQRSLSDRLPFKINVENQLLWPMECMRVEAIKFLAQSPVTALLKPLWTRWNRRL